MGGRGCGTTIAVEPSATLTTRATTTQDVDDSWSKTPRWIVHDVERRVNHFSIPGRKEIVSFHRTAIFQHLSTHSRAAICFCCFYSPFSRPQRHPPNGLGVHLILRFWSEKCFVGFQSPPRFTTRRRKFQEKVEERISEKLLCDDDVLSW